jgi:hypothetical protein
MHWCRKEGRFPILCLIMSRASSSLGWILLAVCGLLADSLIHLFSFFITASVLLGSG